MIQFTIHFGVVTISEPFSSIYHDQKQVEVKYTPHNYHGWGISKSFNAIECQNFTYYDAERFALNAESKLRINGEAA